MAEYSKNFIEVVAMLRTSGKEIGGAISIAEQFDKKITTPVYDHAK
jgi:hypothetical protein